MFGIAMDIFFFIIVTLLFWIQVPLKDMVLCRIKRKKQVGDERLPESKSTVTEDIEYIIGDLCSTLESSDCDTTTTLTLAISQPRCSVNVKS